MRACRNASTKASQLRACVDVPSVAAVEFSDMVGEPRRESQPVVEEEQRRIKEDSASFISTSESIHSFSLSIRLLWTSRACERRHSRDTSLLPMPESSRDYSKMIHVGYMRVEEASCHASSLHDAALIALDADPSGCTRRVCSVCRRGFRIYKARHPARSTQPFSLHESL